MHSPPVHSLPLTHLHHSSHFVQQMLVFHSLKKKKKEGLEHDPSSVSCSNVEFYLSQINIICNKHGSLFHVMATTGSTSSAATEDPSNNVLSTSITKRAKGAKSKRKKRMR